MAIAGVVLATAGARIVYVFYPPSIAAREDVSFTLAPGQTATSAALSITFVVEDPRQALARVFGKRFDLSRAALSLHVREGTDSATRDVDDDGPAHFKFAAHTIDVRFTPGADSVDVTIHPWRPASPPAEADIRAIVEEGVRCSSASCEAPAKSLDGKTWKARCHCPEGGEGSIWVVVDAQSGAVIETYRSGGA
jgi:hypothetical protein